MKRLLIALFGIAVVLVIAVLAAPALIDVRPFIVRAAHDATGRDVRIDGDARLSVWPTPRLVVEGMHLANSPGAATPEMLALDRMVLEARFWPLLRGRLVIDSLSIEGPRVNLEVDRSGRSNWEFAPHTSMSPSASGGIGFAPIRIAHGTLSYRDDSTGQTIDANNVSVTTEQAGPDGPLALHVGMTLNDLPVTFSLAVDSPTRLRLGQPAAVTLALDTKRVTAKFVGDARQRPLPALNGTFDLNVPSFGALAAWLRRPLDPARPDPGPLNVHAMFASDGAKVALSQAAVTGSAIAATARGEVDTGQRPPVFNVAIDVGHADLNAYLPRPTEHQAAARSPDEGWSARPFDLTPLGAANGNARISLAAVRYRDFEITRGDISVALKDRVLRLANGKLTLARGSVDGSGALDASNSDAKLDARVAIAGMPARPLLRTVGLGDRVDGTLAFDAALTSHGGSEAAMVSALNGTGHLRVSDGTVHGINVAQTLRRAGALAPGEPATAETRFAELSTSYTIRSGVIEDHDLSWQATQFRVTGGGTVSLPARSINYAAEATLARMPVAGGRDALADLPIAIKVTGNWANPSYQIDWTSVFQRIAADPQRLTALPADLSRTAKGFGVTLPVPGTNVPTQLLHNLPGLPGVPGGPPTISPEISRHLFGQ